MRRGLRFLPPIIAFAPPRSPMRFTRGNRWHSSFSVGVIELWKAGCYNEARNKNLQTLIRESDSAFLVAVWQAAPPEWIASFGGKLIG
jgi:hypothetical protein